MMRQFFVALAVVLAIAQASSAARLDCAKATQPIEKMLCSTAELRKADDDMSTAYFKLLRETKDPDFHAALIRSQQRWLKQRLQGPTEFRMGDDDTPDDREVLLIWTRKRLEFLTSGRPIRTMEDQRKIAAKDSGEPFAGYTASCNFCLHAGPMALGSTSVGARCTGSVTTGFAAFRRCGRAVT